jgi:FkbM family methyltransferase
MRRRPRRCRSYIKRRRQADDAGGSKSIPEFESLSSERQKTLQAGNTHALDLLRTKMFRNLAREFVPPVFVRALRRCLPTRGGGCESPEDQELARLGAMPSGQPATTTIFGSPFDLVDGRSFPHLYDLYFRKQPCNFSHSTTPPFIIDCGANVGVSVTRWKTVYPGAQVLAFEADPEIFQVLQKNCRRFSDVRLVNAAVWDKEGELPFVAKGGEGGHLAALSAQRRNDLSCSVPCMRLRSFLTQKCDLLKMDIEGAEVAVLRDCADVLHNVSRLFVEYHSFVHQKQLLGETLSLLENAGFRIHVHAKIRSPRPFDEMRVFNEKDLRLDLFCFRDEARPKYILEST